MTRPRVTRTRMGLRVVSIDWPPGEDWGMAVESYQLPSGEILMARAFKVYRQPARRVTITLASHADWER